MKKQEIAALIGSVSEGVLPTVFITAHNTNAGF